MNGTYEVRGGVLLVRGVPLPLSKGLIIVALLRAGWKGRDGLLPADVVRRIPGADPRVALLAGAA